MIGDIGMVDFVSAGEEKNMAVENKDKGSVYNDPLFWYQPEDGLFLARGIMEFGADRDTAAQLMDNGRFDRAAEHAEKAGRREAELNIYAMKIFYADLAGRICDASYAKDSAEEVASATKTVMTRVKDDWAMVDALVHEIGCEHSNLSSLGIDIKRFGPTVLVTICGDRDLSFAMEMYDRLCDSGDLSVLWPKSLCVENNICYEDEDVVFIVVSNVATYLSTLPDIFDADLRYFAHRATYPRIAIVVDRD